MRCFYLFECADVNGNFFWVCSIVRSVGLFFECLVLSDSEGLSASVSARVSPCVCVCTFLHRCCACLRVAALNVFGPALCLSSNFKRHNHQFISV